MKKRNRQFKLPPAKRNCFEVVKLIKNEDGTVSQEMLGEFSRPEDIDTFLREKNITENGLDDMTLERQELFEQMLRTEGLNT